MCHSREWIFPQSLPLQDSEELPQRRPHAKSSRRYIFHAIKHLLRAQRKFSAENRPILHGVEAIRGVLPVDQIRAFLEDERLPGILRLGGNPQIPIQSNRRVEDLRHWVGGDDPVSYTHLTLPTIYS